MSSCQFFNSAYVSAPRRFVLKGGEWARIKLPVRYGLFEHPVAGRCLIDTGYSRRVSSGPRSLALKLYTALLNPKLTSDVLPERHRDVDTILLTHLHADHVSALRDYPNAKILANGTALDSFLSMSRTAQHRHGFFPELLPEDQKTRLIAYESLPCVEAPLGLGPAADLFGDGSVLAVPLPGHMQGHTGILFAEETPPVFYAADADWLKTALLDNRSPGYPAQMILDDTAAAQETASRLRAFSEAGGEILLCHDPEPLP